MNHHIAALATASALLAAGAASAQVQVRSQVVEDQFAHMAETEPDAVSRAGFRGGMAEGGSVVINAVLGAGANYVIIGACDESCTDVDLVVRDSSGAVVGEDVLDDDVPVVAVEGADGGVYAIEFSTAACSAMWCETGVNVYEMP